MSSEKGTTDEKEGLIQTQPGVKQPVSTPPSGARSQLLDYFFVFFSNVSGNFEFQLRKSLHLFFLAARNHSRRLWVTSTIRTATGIRATTSCVWTVASKLPTSGLCSAPSRLRTASSRLWTTTSWLRTTQLWSTAPSLWAANIRTTASQLPPSVCSWATCNTATTSARRGLPTATAATASKYLLFCSLKIKEHFFIRGIGISMQVKSSVSKGCTFDSQSGKPGCFCLVVASASRPDSAWDVEISGHTWWSSGCHSACSPGIQSTPRSVVHSAHRYGKWTRQRYWLRDTMRPSFFPHVSSPYTCNVQSLTDLLSFHGFWIEFEGQGLLRLCHSAVKRGESILVRFHFIWSSKFCPDNWQSLILSLPEWLLSYHK